jgi:hypothetical protein
MFWRVRQETHSLHNWVIWVLSLFRINIWNIHFVISNCNIWHKYLHNSYVRNIKFTVTCSECPDTCQSGIVTRILVHLICPQSSFHRFTQIDEFENYISFYTIRLSSDTSPSASIGLRVWPISTHITWHHPIKLPCRKSRTKCSNGQWGKNNTITFFLPTKIVFQIWYLNNSLERIRNYRANKCIRTFCSLAREIQTS